MSTQRITVPAAKLLKFSSKSPSWSCNMLSGLSVRISPGHAPFTRMLLIVWLSARHPFIWTTAPQTAQRAAKPGSPLRPTAKSYSRAQSCLNESKGDSQGCGFVIHTTCRGRRPADLSKELSFDLRVRVLAAVAAGASHRVAAARFGVNAASVSRWRRRPRSQGDPRPGALGGDRRSSHIEAHHVLIQTGRQDPDVTTEEFRRALGGRVGFGCGTIQRFLVRHGMTRKKKTGHASEQERADVLAR